MNVRYAVIMLSRIKLFLKQSTLGNIYGISSS